MTKTELRRIFRERRRTLSPKEISRLSQKIVDRLLSEIDIGSITALHCYLPLRHLAEIETDVLFDRVWQAHPNVITTAPKVGDTTGDIESHIYQRSSRIIEGAWKIPEPEANEVVAPEAFDLIVVPLLCFDLRGHRVGYGRGFYDRYLRKCRPDCIKAGLSFFPPVAAIDDIHPNDVRLDLCVTPDEAFSFTLP